MGYDWSMSKPNPRHLLASAALALLAALNAPVPAPAQTAVVPPMTGPQIIQMLDQTIDWYRTLGIQQQASTLPSDLLILYDNRQTANQVIGLAFEQPAPKDAGAAASSQTLSQLQDKFAAQATMVQTEPETDQAQLAKARCHQEPIPQCS